MTFEFDTLARLIGRIRKISDKENFELGFLLWLFAEKLHDFDHDSDHFTKPVSIKLRQQLSEISQKIEEALEKSST